MAVGVDGSVVALGRDGVGAAIAQATSGSRRVAMNVERASKMTSLIDVLDRVLDKGIVIAAWVRVSVVGIDLITVEARVVVASIETYLRYSDDFAQIGQRQ